VRKLFAIGLIVFFLGLGLVLVGTAGQGNVSTGGVVFIGPVPIVFGSGPGGEALALMSLLIGGVMIVLFLLWGWRFARMKES
jgi:uncharacterized membrane protein